MDNIGLPKSPLELYIKLYCKRKTGSDETSNDIVAEATKSWASLSKSEKQHFIAKYKECQNEYKKKVVDFLTNAQPFLKKKSSQEGDLSKHMEVEPITVEVNKEVSTKDKIDDNFPEESEFNSYPDESPDSMSIQPDIEAQVPVTTEKMQEPSPPVVYTARGLFEMIKTKNQASSTNQSDLTWSSLTPVQKRKYQQAVRSLKKDYIQKYHLYVGSLTPKELFHHFRDVLNRD